MTDYTKGSKVVDLRGSDLTKGQAYEVVYTVANGGQGWVRVANDKDEVIGYNPSRFVPYQDPETVNLAGLTVEVHCMLEKLLSELPASSSVLAILHEQVAQALAIQKIIVGAAARPVPIGRITFNETDWGVGPSHIEIRVDNHLIGYALDGAFEPYRVVIDNKVVVTEDSSWQLQDKVRAYIEGEVRKAYGLVEPEGVAIWAQHLPKTSSYDAVRIVDEAIRAKIDAGKDEEDQ